MTPLRSTLGVSYAFGEGVKDSVLADMWLNIAGANGKADARERRDELERDMTHTEVELLYELGLPGLRAVIAANESAPPGGGRSLTLRSSLMKTYQEHENALVDLF